VLGLISDYSKVNKEILERACAFGSAVHKVVELYEIGTLDESSLRPKEQYLADMTPILDAWKKCRKEQNLEVLHVEVPVVSMKFRYAGRLDAIAKVNGIPSLIEIKSRPYNRTLEPLQTAAYLEAWNEGNPQEKVKVRYFCELKLDGSYNFLNIKRNAGEPEHFSIFKCLLAVYQWEEITYGK
jgi:hypothetical protein